MKNFSSSVRSVTRLFYGGLDIFRIAVMGWLIATSIYIQSCSETSANRRVDSSYTWEQPVQLNTRERALAHSVDTFFQHKVHKAGLNACVLVAEGGKVIYKNSFGYEDYSRKTKLSDSSEFQLASVSKPFTATAILLLNEQGKLNINDPVAKYIDGFPYEEITIKTLLNHRSGLPNYLYLFDTLKLPADSFISNIDVVNYFVRNKPPLQATPNHKFQYCNSNYALLAYIVEKVSGEHFKDFMQENIFQPSHMSDTYVRDVFDSTQHHHETKGYVGSKWVKVSAVPYDGVLGDKGVYTTSWDLYLFDQALNNGLLLGKETLASAYTGYSYEKPGQKNYGLGWRLKELPDSSKIIYHNGWWRGYNTLFVRKPEKGLCIIILSNKFNRSVYDVKSLYELLNISYSGTEGEE